MQRRCVQQRQDQTFGSEQNKKWKTQIGHKPSFVKRVRAFQKLLQMKESFWMRLYKVG